MASNRKKLANNNDFYKTKFKVPLREKSWITHKDFDLRQFL